MIVLEAEQRTPEWYEARLGRATSSDFKNILGRTQAGKENAARRNYRAQLVVERLTGRTPERFVTKEMEWGTETEELARTEYMLRTGNDVEEISLVMHKTLMAGASPDGKVKEGRRIGGLEIKCFNTANHIEALRTGEMPKLHIPQVQGQMWLTGWRWVDFVSFDPDLPENAQFFLQRIYRDPAYIKNLIKEVRQFLKEVDEEVKFVSNYKMKGPKK